MGRSGNEASRYLIQNQTTYSAGITAQLCGISKISWKFSTHLYELRPSSACICTAVNEKPALIEVGTELLSIRPSHLSIKVL